MRVREDFFRITNILPKRPTNRAADGVLRKDNILYFLATKVFDNPRLLDLLQFKIQGWLRMEQSEFVYALAGYIYYLREDFNQAEGLFLKALSANRFNLDNWYDLAFSLYHQDEKKHALAKSILFNLEYLAGAFKAETLTLAAIEDFLRSKNGKLPKK